MRGLAGFIRHLVEWMEFLLAAIYALWLILSKEQARRIVIYYHGVKDQDVDRFEKQMDYLSRLYQVVKPSEIDTVLAMGKKSLVAITFDDALVSVFKNAAPILRKYDLPAAIFVPTGNLGQCPPWLQAAACYDGQDRVVDEQQLIEMNRMGFEIFSHTVSHPRLSQLNDEELRKELEESKRDLEQYLDREVTAISYPYGCHDERVCEAARRADYQLGFTIEPHLADHSQDPLQTGRFLVSPTDNLLKFKLKVIGAYQVVKYLRRLKGMIIRSKQAGCR